MSELRTQTTQLCTHEMLRHLGINQGDTHPVSLVTLLGETAIACRPISKEPRATVFQSIIDAACWSAWPNRLIMFLMLTLRNIGPVMDLLFVDFDHRPKPIKGRVMRDSLTVRSLS